jgi:hypothetical protein
LLGRKHQPSLTLETNRGPSSLEHTVFFNDDRIQR